MPGLATVALLVAIIIGCGQLLFLLVARVVLREREFIKRQSLVNFTFAVYSGVDWLFDLIFVSKAFARGYATYVRMRASEASEPFEHPLGQPLGIFESHALR